MTFTDLNCSFFENGAMQVLHHAIIQLLASRNSNCSNDNFKVDSKMMKVDNKVEPITTIDTESNPDIRPSTLTQKAFGQQSQILHYFSWFSDIFLSIASTGVWGAMIHRHNMLEEPSYL